MGPDRPAAWRRAGRARAGRALRALRPAGPGAQRRGGFDHRTGYEWLSRDEAEVDRYVADPLCGFDTPPGTLPSLFAPAARLADPDQLARIRKDLPLLIASGTADPLAGGGQLAEQLGRRYLDAGIVDVTVTTYPDARHEIFNETNRDQVTADIPRFPFRTMIARMWTNALDRYAAEARG